MVSLCMRATRLETIVCPTRAHQTIMMMFCYLYRKRSRTEWILTNYTQF
uniref:Putative ORF6 protein n=1 Tax=Zaria bat coronavirus TaxID=989337 RepID=F1BYM3_9BETC|nr:putative ORF6 protein [Zaria bat coronavirus]